MRLHVRELKLVQENIFEKLTITIHRIPGKPLRYKSTVNGIKTIQLSKENNVGFFPLVFLVN